MYLDRTRGTLICTTTANPLMVDSMPNKKEGKSRQKFI
jgi:hypothetical protein